MLCLEKYRRTTNIDDVSNVCANRHQERRNGRDIGALLLARLVTAKYQFGVLLASVVTLDSVSKVIASLI